MPMKKKMSELPMEEQAFRIADELINWWASAAFDIADCVDPEPGIDGEDLPRDCMAERGTGRAIV